MRKYLSLLFSALIILSLAACKRVENKNEKSPAGYYDIVLIESDEGKTTASELEQMGWNIFLVMNEDGTGVLDMDDGDIDEFTWGNGVITSYDKEYTYYFEDGLLSLDLSDEDGDFALLFHRTSSIEDYNEASTSDADGYEDEVVTEVDENSDNSDVSEVPNNTDGTKQYPIAGNYRLIYYSDEEGMILSEDTIREYESQITRKTSSLYISDDGFIRLVTFGNEIPVQWDGGEEIVLDGVDSTITFDNGIATIRYKDKTLIFDSILKSERNSEAEPVQSTETQPVVYANGFETVVGNISIGQVSIVGAEQFTDAENDDAVRFYYDFTNKSDEIIYPGVDLIFDAIQNGYSMEETYAQWDDIVDERINQSRGIEPGASIRCIKEYKYDPDGSEITFSVSSLSSSRIIGKFDPSDLPGRPPMPINGVKIDDPTFFSSYGRYAETDSVDVDIVDANETQDSEGQDCIRVILEVTNNTDRAVDPTWLVSTKAYQDGIELMPTFTEDSDGLEDSAYKNISPGETCTYALAFGTLSNSPCEITVADVVDYSDEIIAAATFPIS